MAKDRTQLNINIDPNLLLLLKSEAIKSGQTLTVYVTKRLQATVEKSSNNLDSLEARLLAIEKHLNLSQKSSQKKNNEEVIFTDEGAKKYGEVAKSLFEAQFKSMGISRETALKELNTYLQKYDNSEPELVRKILLGEHNLTGREMTHAYRFGSCAMRSALYDWCKKPLDELNEAFLNAVITKSLV